MSSIKKVIIGAFISAGVVFTIGFKRRKKTDNQELTSGKQEKESTLSYSRDKNETASKTNLEITTNISIELNKKSELIITKQNNFILDKIILANKTEIPDNLNEEISEDKENISNQNSPDSIKIRAKRGSVKSIKPIKEIENESRSPSRSRDVVSKSKSSVMQIPCKNENLKTFKEDEIELNIPNNPQSGIIIDEKINRKISEHENISSIKIKSSKMINNLTLHLQNKQNTSLLNFFDDLKFQEDINSKLDQFAKESNFDPQSSIFLPDLTQEINEEIKNTEAGYFEEDDDEEDLKDLNFSLPEKIENQTNKDNSLSFSKIPNTETVTISNPEDVNKILISKYPPKNISLLTIHITLDNEVIEVIKADLFLIILRNIYSQLNSTYIDLSDNFTDQRRLHFAMGDQSTYISIIELYLRKKNDFFLGALTNLMTKFNISQTLFDNTNMYYMNYADQEDELVQDIIRAFDKIESAGNKNTIAPRNLNKNVIKEILIFICEKLDELTLNHNYEPELIEIIAFDYTYAEFGFDRDTIRSAMIKHKIINDKEFDNWLVKIKDFKLDLIEV